MVGHWYIMLFDPEVEYHGGAGDDAARRKARRNKEAVAMILIVASLIEVGIE